MNAHHILWKIAVLVCGVAAGLLGLLSLAGTGVLVTLLFGGIVGGVLAHLDHERLPRRRSFRRAARITLLGPGIALAVAGLAIASGPAGILLGVALAAFVPRALLRRWFAEEPVAAITPRQRSRTVADLSAYREPVRIQGLSDEELCRLWRTSTATVRPGGTVAQRLAVVRTREVILDEFHRRDPAGFHRWTAAGPSADTDPADFLGTRRESP